MFQFCDNRVVLPIKFTDGQKITLKLMFSLFSARSVLNEIYLQRCPSSVIATQFHYKSTYVLQISIQFCFVLWNLVDTFNRIQLLLYFMYKFTTKCEWVNCMHIKTMKQPNPEDLEYYIYKYSNYCRPRKINFKLRTAWVDEI